jgi:hypothetical protein
VSNDSAIEWTDAPLKVRKTAAARIGVTLDEYDQRRAAGEKWCTGCKQWHPHVDFNIDRSRGDGLGKWCRAFATEQGRTHYTPRPRPAAGRRFVAARDGDQQQARRRVNHLVDVGLLPDPNDRACNDCGHVYTEGERRHEYDHHRGYEPEHHEHVEPVCTTCHHARETQRRAG